MEIVAGKGARRCECRIRAHIKQFREPAIAAIPSLYEGFSLENLVADNERHKAQAEEIEKIKANPNSNFAICGTFGSGKTHLLYSLYRTQLETRRVFAGTLEEIIAEHKARFDNPNAPAVSITPESLAQKSTPWTLFIDDIDKETPTEFVCKILFALVNAATNFKQQIVFTTNLKPARLVSHFERADERFGGAIARRLMDNSEIIKMF